MTNRRQRVARSLVFRLTTLYAVSASLLVLVAVSIVYRELVHDVDREDDTVLRENALLLDSILLRPPAEPRQLLLDMQSARSTLGAQRILFRIVDGAGDVLVETPEMGVDLPRAVFPKSIEPGDADARGVDVVRGDSHPYRLMTAELQSTVLGGPDACVQLALDRRSEAALFARYRNLLLLVTIPTLLACALVGQRIARRAIAPIRELATAMARIQPASLDERVPDGHLATELRPLVESFNDLLARLQASFQQLQRFSSNIAHELRTPINNLCGEIEVALAEPGTPAGHIEVLRSCREEAASLSRIIDSLLFLAYAQLPGARIAQQPLDMAAEIADIAEFYEPVAAEAGVQLATVTAAGPLVAADRTMLQRAVVNLLTNAIAFTGTGGTITVSVRHDGGAAEVQVADNGSGIRKELIPDLLQGVYRADVGARGQRAGLGLGLGLSIVHSVMRLHHGSMQIDSDVGRGCRVTLRFPAMPMP